MVELFKKLKRVDEVLKELSQYLKARITTVKLNISEALGHYLAEDVYAKIDIPYFNRSVVDGFAICSEDTFGASLHNPAILKIVRVEKPESYELKRGEAVEVFTGSPLPRNADAVVMYEDVNIREDFIEVTRPIVPYSNVSKKGEDFRKGELVLKKGTKLRPWDIAVLASLGYRQVEVYKPRVALLCTGDELVELYEVDDILKIPYGKIINSTRYVVEGLLKEFGCEVTYLGVVPDNDDVIANTLRKVLSSHDLVVTIGGVSVGKRDLTFKAVLKLDPEYYCHGLAIRPGRPTSVAIINGKLVIMLSGFPVAALTGFEFLLRPILLKLIDGVDELRPTVKGKLLRRINKPINVKALVRVKVCRENNNYIIEPLALTGSGVLSTLSKSNGVIIISEDVEGFDENSVIEVILTRYQ
ncbi:MAG: molybdopterin molybdenumtransferase MoeA [Thermoprotei archaeon ex4572_64]|nr:MAG: molybdopterin molybdenumtransferase MoeA [Thermoprotei archaeon ex4572_64]